MSLSPQPPARRLAPSSASALPSVAEQQQQQQPPARPSSERLSSSGSTPSPASIIPSGDFDPLGEALGLSHVSSHGAVYHEHGYDGCAQAPLFHDHSGGYDGAPEHLKCM